MCGRSGAGWRGALAAARRISGRVAEPPPPGDWTRVAAGAGAPPVLPCDGAAGLGAGGSGGSGGGPLCAVPEPGPPLGCAARDDAGSDLETWRFGGAGASEAGAVSAGATGGAAVFHGGTCVGAGGADAGCGIIGAGEVSAGGATVEGLGDAASAGGSVAGAPAGGRCPRSAAGRGERGGCVAGVVGAGGVGAVVLGGDPARAGGGAAVLDRESGALAAGTGGRFESRFALRATCGCAGGASGADAVAPSMIWAVRGGAGAVDESSAGSATGGVSGLGVGAAGAARPPPNNASNTSSGIPCCCCIIDLNSLATAPSSEAGAASGAIATSGGCVLRSGAAAA
jgi:hypothetical protein